MSPDDHLSDLHQTHEPLLSLQTPKQKPMVNEPSDFRRHLYGTSFQEKFDFAPLSSLLKGLSKHIFSDWPILTFSFDSPDLSTSVR